MPIDEMNWRGPLTIKNLPDVTEALQRRLEGKLYNRSTYNGLFSPPVLVELKEHRYVKPPLGSNVGAIYSWISQSGSYGMIVVYEEGTRKSRHAACTWDMGVNEETSLEFGENIVIKTRASAGNYIIWKLEIEGEHDGC